MVKLTQYLANLSQYQAIVKGLKPKTRQLITGMSGSAQTLFLDALFQGIQKPLLIVADTLHHMSQIADDFANIVPEDQIFEFPVEELVAAEVATSSPQYRAQRVKALHALQTGKPVIVITSVSGIRRRLPDPKTFQAAQLNVKKGDHFKLEHLRLMLHQMGYLHKNLVSAPGEFAIRGSIVDVYPLNSNYPVRIDFFDTEVDSLRLFDAAKQSSLKTIATAKILPATDFVVTDAQYKKAAQAVNDRLHKSYHTIKDNKLKRTLTTNIKPVIAGLQKGLIDSRWLLYADDLFDHENSIMDYLPKDAVVVFNDYTRLTQSNQMIVKDEKHWVEGQLENAKLLAGTKFSVDFLKEAQKGSQPQLYLALFDKKIRGLKLDDSADLKARTIQHFWGRLPMFKKELTSWQKAKQTIVIMVSNQKRMDKVAKLLEPIHLAPNQVTWDTIDTGKLQMIPESLSQGFAFRDANLVVVTEGEIFKKVHKRHRKRQTFANAQRIKSYSDLRPGDYVVHVDHGIGKYLGMKTMKVDGKHQDYLSIAYRDNAKLFIPVTQLNLIQKYVSSEDHHPRVNRLGGKSWAKTKRRVAHKIEDIADNLISLYAKRAGEKGFAFPPDDARQKEFENNFAYQLTPDQQRSTNEIKGDMEKPQPMDRLLVGDVGYGKTEVALRAAFKAMEGGKQVVLLVPTTVLVDQHYQTMKHRFAGFGINIGVLSRFRTPKQIKQTLADLKSGKCNIVVGTHRLLSKDVHFKDLGLLIIDEEQRFGVKDKNKIKTMKSSIDVLSLTATPIPRTLNMSMIGVRDLSIIETPPTNRVPVQTYVMEENAGAIQDGIHREMERHGQVFFLHNRVADIEKTMHKLQKLVPDAKIAYIDGQMNESTMESVLYKFIHDEYDVLVTTTIVGNGVDIPNANTLFVENADHLGLAQLYQIRGRVGRSNRVAYAYFMYQPNKVLTQVGENRLEAIRDFTELGSGFKIAMRDLSIRGAGNLLGRQQHGFINSVGYDLYTQMLNTAVAKKRGHNAANRINTQMALNLEAYLPTSYINDGQQKIEMYKRIRQMNTLDEYDTIKHNLLDRFGRMPDAVKCLLQISRIKMAADTALIANIHRIKQQITVVMSVMGTQVYSSADFLRAIAKTKFKASINEIKNQMQIKLMITTSMTKDHAWLVDLDRLVEALKQRRMQIIDQQVDRKTKAKKHRQNKKGE